MRTARTQGLTSTGRSSMRYVSLFTLSVLLLGGAALAAEQPATQPAVSPDIAASRAAAQKFGATLQAALKQAMQSGGPVNGIAVCHDTASQIAAAVSKNEGMTIRRTSLKPRNSANAPDAWELAVLKEFEVRKAQGEPADKLEFSAVVDGANGQRTFRYMKAIPTAALCLACHGEHISPDVKAKLNELYPNDMAHGYKEGDLRGAFTISRTLP
ncbi:MAG: DUF3365 domain-containing protein [Candidatus Baltobacteraceae bacterium]